DHSAATGDPLSVIGNDLVGLRFVEPLKVRTVLCNDESKTWDRGWDTMHDQLAPVGQCSLQHGFEHLVLLTEPWLQQPAPFIEIVRADLGNEIELILPYPAWRVRNAFFGLQSPRKVSH